MRKLSAVVTALVLACAGLLANTAPAAAASRQLCTNINRTLNGFAYVQARVCLNYIPAIRPTSYYLVESMRVWNPCNVFDWEQYSVMKFWANNGAYYSVYTGAIRCGNTYVKTWPNPRVDNGAPVYFDVDDAAQDGRCVHMRPPTWEYTQNIWITGSELC